MEQKLTKIVDSLEAAYTRRDVGDAQEGEAEGAPGMSWLTGDLQRLGMDVNVNMAGQYNVRVNLTTPTNALPSAPSSAGAFDAEALSDDSMELPENMPIKKKFVTKTAAQQASARRRNKSKSAIIPPTKPKPSRAKQGSMFTGR